jgi:hypothetical protein
MKPTDRAAHLANQAGKYLSFERFAAEFGQAGRNATIDMLRNDARRIGFAADEIEAAVEAAIAAATQEPRRPDAGSPTGEAANG